MLQGGRRLTSFVNVPTRFPLPKPKNFLKIETFKMKTDHLKTSFEHNEHFSWNHEAASFFVSYSKQSLQQTI